MGFLNVYFQGAAGASCAAGEGKPAAEAGSTAGRGSVVHKRHGPTAAKQQSRAGLVAATGVSTTQWLLDKSQWWGKSEVSWEVKLEDQDLHQRGTCQGIGMAATSQERAKKECQRLKKLPSGAGETKWDFLPLSHEAVSSAAWPKVIPLLALSTGCQTHRARQDSWPSLIHWSESVSYSLTSPFSAQT